MSQGRIKTIGVVKRVAAKFAYITTDYGVVFCPLAAAVPPEENVPYLNERYTINDKVHVIAVKQEGKNGCDFRATKVRPVVSEQASSMGDSCTWEDQSVSTEDDQFVGSVIGDVTTVHDSYVFCLYRHNYVFVPGDAFDTAEVTCLERYLTPGDKLKLTIKYQDNPNCQYIALFATKVDTVKERIFRGHGVIRELDQLHAIVWSHKHGEIDCPILTWFGGDGGKSDVWLNDLLQIGDVINYQITLRDSTDWKVVAWTAPGFKSGLPQLPLMESFTQTTLSPERLALRILIPHVADLLQKSPEIKTLLDSLNLDDRK